jgi:spermidine synthase
MDLSMATKARWNVNFYFVLIFLSGLTFLIFEVSWFRMLSLTIGSTSSASTLVLSAFLSGMGLGAHFWGKRSSSLRLHFLFAIIAILGAATSFAISRGIPLLYQAVSLPWIGYIAAIMVIFIPTFFMGSILPLMAEKISQFSKNKNRSLGQLYALETLGSVTGGLLTGFLLIKILGQSNTILFAVVIILLQALVLFIWQRKPLSETTNTVNEPKPRQTEEPGPATGNLWKTALIATFICGFLMISMQIIWFRFFKVYFVNTSYTFATISSIVILGLFLGSWLYSATTKRVKAKPKTLNLLLLLMSFVTLAGMVFLVDLPTLIMIPMATSQEDYFLRILVLPILSALIVIIPPTLLSGYCFPLIWSMVTEGQKQIGSRIGTLVLANSLGSVIGPILTTFVLIPYFGGALSTLVCIVPVLASMLWISSIHHPFKARKGFNLGISGALICLIIIVAIHPQIRILPPSFSKYPKKVLSYGETMEGTYIVGQDMSSENPVISTYVNNSSVIGSTYDAIKAVKMVGHIPFLMGLECKNALVVGFGIGVTTSAIASHPEVANIDCIELVSDLKKVAHYYKEINGEIYNDARVKVHQGDGRHYLQSTHQHYDLISSDPTHPILGSGSIYTREYFELCKAHLTDRGMISQYLPLHKLRLEDFLGILKTFKSVFPDATLWIGQYHAILIASKAGDSTPIDFRKWRTETEKLRKDPYFYDNPYHLAACMTLDSQQLDEITSDAAMNTDDKSYVEFFSFDAFKGENLPNNLAFLNEHRGGVNRIFTNIDDPRLMSKFIYSNQIFTDGIIAMLRGDNQKYKEALVKAQHENPENQEYPFLLKLLFSN